MGGNVVGFGGFFAVFVENCEFFQCWYFVHLITGQAGKERKVDDKPPCRDVLMYLLIVFVLVLLAFWEIAPQKVFCILFLLIRQA